MAKKPTLTEAARALEQAARVATKGPSSDRAGRVTIGADREVAPDVAEGAGSVAAEAPTDDRMVIYEGAAGAEIELQFTGSTMWATQAQLAELFGITQATVSRHLKSIYAEGELAIEGTYTENVYVGVSGQSYTRRLYNLDAIISVGYRVNSRQGTTFRRWATDKLVQYAIKGFALDDARLKSAGGNDYFSELRERIRDIRASEANVYKELRSICAMCSDYDPQSQSALNFFAGMQNKLLWATTSHTAPEIIVDRADAGQPDMGLTAWTGKQGVAKADVTVAKNYLGQQEITDLNRLTNMVLDYFEDQTERRRVVTMIDLEQQLGEFITFNKRPLLGHNGKVTRKVADKHALAEYEKYKEVLRLQRQTEGEAAISKLIGLDKAARRPRRQRA